MIPRRVKNIYLASIFLIVLSGFLNIYFHYYLIFNIIWALVLIANMFLNYVLFMNAYLNIIYKSRLIKYNVSNNYPHGLINFIKHNILSSMVDFNAQYKLCNKMVIIYLDNKKHNKSIYKSLKNNIPEKMFCIITNRKKSQFWSVERTCKNFILSNELNNHAIIAKRLMMGLNVKKIRSNPKDFLNKVAITVNAPDEEI